MEPISNDDPFYHAGMVLDCGARVEITQQNDRGNIDLVVTPGPGLPISDTADFKDGNLRVRLTEKSFAQFYLLLYAVCGPIPNQKKKLSWFQYFKNIAFLTLMWYALFWLVDTILRHFHR